jgi:hypothetical protein
MKVDFFRKKTVADFKETSENGGLKKNLRAFAYINQKHGTPATCTLITGVVI